MSQIKTLNNLFFPKVNTVETKTKTSTFTSTSFLASMQSVIQSKVSTLKTSTATTVTTVTDEPTQYSMTLRADKQLSVPHLLQGNKECGHAALAMALKYTSQQTNTPSLDPGNFHAWSPFDDVGHGPLNLQSIASQKGAMTRMVNGGTDADLAALIDKGLPPIVLGINGGAIGSSSISISNIIDNASRAHWMTVTGYVKNDRGQITHFYINDPNRTSDWRCPVADFHTFWDKNIIPGGNRFYMTIAKPGSFQASFLQTFLPQNKLSDSFRIKLKAVDALEKMYYQVREAGGDAYAAAKKLSAKIEALIKKGGSNLAQEIDKAFNEVFNAVIDALHALADAAEDVGDEIADWVGGLFG